jgi:UDP-glucose 4,6-dehydratase
LYLVPQVHARNDTHTVLAPFQTHLPNLDFAEKMLVAIPCGWWVTNDQREYVVKSMHEFCASSSNIIARKLTASSSSEDEVTKSSTTKNTSSVPRHVAHRKIIITGGCSFTGHHIVDRL